MPGMSHLFVPGPTNIPESIRKAIDIPMEDHRAPDMPEFTLPLFADLKTVFKTVTGSVFFCCLGYRRLGSRDYQYTQSRRQGAGRAVWSVLASLD
jgi:hypothetical protein